MRKHLVVAVGAATAALAVFAPFLAAADAAENLADLALSDPLNGTVEVAGPERFRLHELASEVLTAYEDPRRVTVDDEAPYFGARLDEASLLPGETPRLAPTRFHDWLRASLQAPVPANQNRRKQG